MVINLKDREMVFEKKSLHVVIPLDPEGGVHCVASICDGNKDTGLDHIYQITAQRPDWASPTPKQRISKEHVKLCDLDSDEEDERWRIRLSSVTTLNCNMITQSLYCVKVQD